MFWPWLPLEREDHGISEWDGTKISFNTACWLHARWKWGQERPSGSLELCSVRRETRCWHGHDIKGIKSKILQILSQAKSRMNSSFLLGGKTTWQNPGGEGPARAGGRKCSTSAPRTQIWEILPLRRCDINRLIKYLNKSAIRAAQGWRWMSVTLKYAQQLCHRNIKGNTSPQSPGNWNKNERGQRQTSLFIRHWERATSMDR